MPTRTKPTSSARGAPRTSRKAATPEDSEISGSDSDDDMVSARASPEATRNSEDDLSSGSDEMDSDDEEQDTAAARRLAMAARYLENVKEQVDTIGFDAEEIDRDMIAERLQEDIAETKGKVYRMLANSFAFSRASHTIWKANTHGFTSVAVHEPFAYTVTKDLHVQKWRLQDLPHKQFPQTTRRKPSRPDAPPRKKPTLVTYVKGDRRKSKDRDYQRHTADILAVAVSPDGKFLATGGADRKLIIYNTETLSPIKVWTHHRDAVTGLAFRRGTNQLFSCSKDRTVKVWSLNEMAYVETLFGHQDDVVDIAALAQERCVSVGSRDRTARLWKVAEESQLVFRGGANDKKTKRGLHTNPTVDPLNPRIPNEGTLDRVAMIDDELFVTGGDNGALSLWSVTKKKPLSIVPVAHGFEPCLTPAQASSELNPEASAVPEPSPRYITAICTVPYSDLVLSGSWDGYIRVWRLSDDKRTLEPMGVLGPNEEDDEDFEVRGVINDIAVFERGEKGSEGLCVVAAVGKEHRFGRWKTVEGGRNGGVVFEVSRGTAVQEDEDDDEDESSDGSSAGFESE